MLSSTAQRSNILLDDKISAINGQPLTISLVVLAHEVGAQAGYTTCNNAASECRQLLAKNSVGATPSEPTIKILTNGTLISVEYSFTIVFPIMSHEMVFTVLDSLNQHLQKLRKIKNLYIDFEKCHLSAH